MKLIQFYARSIYSVYFDQEWYWRYVRPRLEGVSAWGLVVGVGLIVWLKALCLATLCLLLARWLNIEQGYLEVYIATTRFFGSLVVLSMVFGIGSKNKLLWTIPTLVSFGPLMGFSPLLAGILIAPGLDSRLVLLVLVCLAFVLGGCVGLIFTLARGEGVLEMLAGMIRSSWGAIPLSKAWSALLTVTITALVALVFAPFVVIFHSGWQMGVGTQTALIGLAIFFGVYTGEAWTKRQISEVAERKRLADCPER